jgi:hypothetical protein
MAAEHRIIGGGLLLVGVAVAVLLLVFFNKPKTPPDEAGQELLRNVYPAYLAAELRGDYAEMRKQADRALEILDRAGVQLVRAYLRVEGTERPEAARLEQAIAAGAFQKNRDDLYEFDGDWYGPPAHQALLAVKRADSEAAKNLRALRRLAEDTAKALGELREGSGHPLDPPPPPKPSAAAPPEAARPVLEADAERYRVFGLPARDAEAALKSPDPGGKAASARIRWNRDIARGGLAERLEELGSLVESLTRTAIALKAAAKPLEADAGALRKARSHLERAAAAIAAGYPEPVLAALAAPDSLARFLEAEAEMLRPLLVTARELAAVVRTPFAG